MRRIFRKETTYPTCSAFFVGLCCLINNLLVSYILSLLASKGIIYYENASELSCVLTDTLAYICLLTPPIIIACILFKTNPIKAILRKPAAPRLPFIFIFSSIGLGYLANIIVNLIAGDYFSKFDPSVSASDFYTSPTAIFLYFIYSCILPAIIEEAFYRGILLKNLMPYGKWFAIFVSSTIFALSHISPSQSIFAFVMGLLLGYAYVETQSIWFGSLIHLVVNTFSFGVGYWFYVFQSETVTNLFSIIENALVLMGIMSLFVYFIPYKRFFGSKNQYEIKLASAKTFFSNPLFYAMFLLYILLLLLYNGYLK